MEIEKLIAINRQLKRRMNQRQLQSAMYGISGDPSIIMETEDLSKAVIGVDELIEYATRNRMSDIDISGVTDALRSVGVIVYDD